MIIPGFGRRVQAMQTCVWFDPILQRIDHQVAFIQIGPFFGDALRHCKKAGALKVSLMAMIGKLAKFAGGNESVHSTASSQDFDFLAQLATAAGADAALAAGVRAANTAQEAAALMAPVCPGFFTLLCRQAWHFGQSLLGDNVRLEVFLTGIHGEVLGHYQAAI